MNSQIDRVIAMGKPIAVIRKLVETELLKQDKATWNNEKQEEYDALYYEDIEYIEVVQNDEGNDVEVTKTKTELKLTAPTFTDWLKETKTIIEAVEATYDEDGTILIEAVVEIVELVREFVAPEVTEAMLDSCLNSNYDYIKNARAESMMTGKDYNGYQISLTAEDGNGLLQAKAAFELGVASTNFKCANGTIMPILAKDFLAFGMWFVTERNRFFEGL